MKDSIIWKRIGLYDVLYECDYKANDGHKLYHVRCSQCGFETNMTKSHLTQGSICHHKTLHGGYINHHIKWKNDRLHRIYRGIIKRCYNKHDKSYRWYGDKGVKVYDEWLNNPLSFEQWAFDNGYDNTLTIDRIDESKDYCPENCRWVTMVENSKHKSTTNEIEVDGVTHTGNEWADILNLGKNTINTILRTYNKDVTVAFIKARQQDMTKLRPHNKSWLSVYGIL